MSSILVGDVKGLGTLHLLDFPDVSALGLGRLIPALIPSLF